MLGREISRHILARLNCLGLRNAGPRMPPDWRAADICGDAEFLEKFGMNSLSEPLGIEAIATCVEFDHVSVEPIMRSVERPRTIFRSLSTTELPRGSTIKEASAAL